VIKRLALVLVALSTSLFASGCVQDIWNSYIAAVAKFTGDTTYNILDTFFPI
jgi:hypothetical protein